MAAVVPQAVPYEETAKTNPLPQHNVKKPYAPPAKKGMFGSFSRALAFMGQIFSLAGQHKALLKPLLWDVLLTTPIMALFTVLDFIIPFRAEWQVYARTGSPGELRPDNPRYARRVRLWKRLPLWLTRLVGPRIVRGIP